MKILNIAHGELLMLGAYTAFWAFTLAGVHPIVSVLLTGPLLAAAGFVIHAVVVRPIVRASPTVERLERSTLIGFFGVLIVIQNVALLLWTADYRVVSVLQEPVPVLNVSTARVAVFAIAVALVLSLYVLLMRTRFGAAIRAVSQDRDMAAMLLETSGFDAITAGNGLEGVLVAHYTRPAVVLMDVAMPVLDGLQATRLLKASEVTQDISVIAYTAKMNIPEAPLARLFVDVLMKPASPEAIVAAVHRSAFGSEPEAA